MSDSEWIPARMTEPPKTVDLSMIYRPATALDPFPRRFDLSSDEPITFNLNEHSYRLPAHTRFVRYGMSQEGLSVEYQDADGDWHGAPPSDDL